MEYRSRHKAASKLQRLWRTRRDRRRDEAEKLRRIKIHEVGVPSGGRRDRSENCLNVQCTKSAEFLACHSVGVNVFTRKFYG